MLVMLALAGGANFHEKPKRHKTGTPVVTTKTRVKRPAPALSGHTPALSGHNGGPPLDDPKEREHVPPWGRGGIKTFFSWQAAHRAAWRKPARDIVLTRLEKAESLGLTYEEYTLEILERGIYLQKQDVEQISRIKLKRKAR
jgi:hypothetical protein